MATHTEGSVTTFNQEKQTSDTYLRPQTGTINTGAFDLSSYYTIMTSVFLRVKGQMIKQEPIDTRYAKLPSKRPVSAVHSRKKY